MTQQTSIYHSTTLQKILPIVICTLASLFYVYDYFIQVAPSVMTNALMHDFAIGAGKLGLLGACFYYAYMLMQIPAGILLDRLGARILIATALLLSAFGVILFGATHVFVLAGLSRLLIGAGSAFSFISALFLVARWFQHRRFALIAGFIQLAGCVGSMFGLAPLAAWINHVGWRHAMVETGLFTLFLALITWLIIRDGPPQAAPVKRNSSFREEFQRLKKLAQISQLWVIAGVGLVSWVPVGVIGALWGVPYLMQVYGITNTAAGQWVSLFWVALAVGSPLVGWYSNHIRRRITPIKVCLLCAILGAVLLLGAPHLPIEITGLALLLLGFSASIQSLSFGLVKDIVPLELFGAASGFNNMAAIIGSGLAQPLVGYILHRTWTGAHHQGVPVYAVSDYQWAFVVMPIAAVVGLVVSYRIVETFCQSLGGEAIDQ